MDSCLFVYSFLVPGSKPNAKDEKNKRTTGTLAKNMAPTLKNKSVKI